MKKPPDVAALHAYWQTWQSPEEVTEAAKHVRGAEIDIPPWPPEPVQTTTFGVCEAVIMALKEYAEAMRLGRIPMRLGPDALCDFAETIPVAFNLTLRKSGR